MQTQTIELSPLQSPEIFSAVDLFASPENLSCFIAASAECVPELHVARHAARLEAEARLECNMEFVREGEFDKAPAPIDVLGTARRVLNVEKDHGENSTQYAQIKQGLVDDCSRLYAEARRKNAFEYFAPVRHEYDELQGEFFAYGYSMRELVAGGLSPYITEKEEKQRRINENVEEATYEAAMKLANADNVGVITVSQCTDWAIESYQKKPDIAHGGYVPEIEKMMIRYVSFDTHEKCRYVEQMGIPGKLITNQIVTRALEIMEIDNAKDMDKNEVHAAQLLVERQQISDVVDFVSLLDRVATEHYGFEVFLGDRVSDEHYKDYAAIKTEATSRQAEYQADSEQLADFLVELEQNKTDVWVAEAIVAEHIKEKLLTIAKQSPDQARIIFDEKTANGFEHVNMLESEGRFDEARLYENEIQNNAPSIEFCGAGSCGLESAESSAAEALARSRMGSSDDEKIVRDTQRSCGKCGEKGKVWYSFNTRIVRKNCGNCNVLEINGKTVSLN